MKLVPIAIAAALACGSAFAQTPGPAQRAENRAKAAEVADKATPGPAQRAQNRAKAADVADKAGNVAEKGLDGAKRAGRATKRGVQRAAEVTGDVTRNAASKVRNTGEALARRLPPAPAERGVGADRSGSTAMGAGPAVSGDAGDGNRRQRMDDAYGNWQRQQGSR